MLATCIPLSIVAGLAWYKFVALARRERYVEFYKTYDDDVAWERMRKTGMFQGAPLDEEE